MSNEKTKRSACIQMADAGRQTDSGLVELAGHRLAGKRISGIRRATKDLASEAVTSSEEPRLVSWSTEEVKKYFDKNVDWNIPFPSEKEFQEEPVEGAAAGSGSGGGTTVVNNYGGYNSGFGWDDFCSITCCSTMVRIIHPADGTIIIAVIMRITASHINPAPIQAVRSRTNRW